MADSLVLNWSKTGVVAVTAAVSGQQIRVQKTVSMTWPEHGTPSQNPNAAANALKEALKQAGIQAEEAVICLARDAAVTRMLDVPRVSDDELTEIVLLQAATRSSQPAEQLLIDYLPQPSQPGRELGSVLAATLDRSTADAIRKIAKAVGLEVTGIGLSSVGLAEIAVGSRSTAPNDTLVGAAIIDSRLEVCLVHKGNISFLQSAVLSEVDDDTLCAEMRRILFSAQQILTEFDVDHLILFVDPSQRDLFPQLQEEYGSKLTVQTLKEAPQIQLAGSLPASVSPTSLIFPLGVLLNRALHTLPGIDFLHPREKQSTQDDSKRKLAIYAAGIVTILVLGLYGYSNYLGSMDEDISRLEFGESSMKQNLQEGAPAQEADADLQEWLARDVHTLLELEKMQNTLPGTSVAYLNEYNFDVALGKNLAKVNGKGMATERDVVEQIYRDFDAAGFNVYSAEIETSRRRDADYPAEFTLTLERPSESTAQTSQTR